jgi:threonine/homoserine/homoserine lactone efflux protein
MLRVFVNGLSTGLVLQLAIGPVFFFILNITLQRSLLDGLLSVLAVTVVDYVYITLAITGVGKLLEKKTVQKKLALISSMVLVIFGIIMLVSARDILTETKLQAQPASDYGSSFLSAFLLTLSSPLTIVFWTGLFAAKAIEYTYSKRQLVVFGFSAGLATLLFLGCAVVILSLVQASVPALLVRLLNVLVGALLILYGVIRFSKVIRGK